MRLRSKKPISENLPNSSNLDDIGVSQTSRKRKNNSISGNSQGNRSRKPKTNASNINHQIGTSSDKVGVSQTSMNIVGVTKRKSGKYGVKIHDRIRKKDVWLGTYESAEEATRVYWAKKEELEKEFEGIALRVSETETKRTSEYVGVSRRASGKFAAHIRDPIRKKKLYLGAFDSEEEASKVYLAKREELEKEVKGMKGVQWTKRRECRKATSLVIRKRRSVGESSRCCNQESSMVIDDFDSCNGETDSSDSGISKESSSILEEDNDACLVDNQESSREFDESNSLIGESAPSNAGVSNENSPILEQNNEVPCSDNQESSKEFDKSNCLVGESAPSNAEVSKDKSPILEQNNEVPCSDNQESSKEQIDHVDSSHKEAAATEAGAEDLPIQKNVAEKELVVVDSSVESLVNPPGRCSDGKVLLRTKSGTPLMDCNGYLLGEWSWIDDLSLSGHL